MSEDFPPKVFYAMLNALHIDIGEFVYQLLNDQPKETMIYAKMYALYHYSKSASLSQKQT